MNRWHDSGPKAASCCSEHFEQMRRLYNEAGYLGINTETSILDRLDGRMAGLAMN
jgi:hypothetical protein